MNFRMVGPPQNDCLVLPSCNTNAKYSGFDGGIFKDSFKIERSLKGVLSAIEHLVAINGATEW